MGAHMATRVKATQKRQMAGFWFVLPAFLVYCLFFAYPFFRTVYLSFTEWNGLGEPAFVGLANYARLLGDGQMWLALGNNIIWVIWGTIIPIAIGLVLSVILWTGVKGSIVFRTIYFLPMVLSPVVVGVIWGWIYNPLFGVLNQGLNAIGLGNWARGWLGEPGTALYAVMLTAIWTYIGFCVVVLFSGLQKVDSELVDASRIDGASTFQRFWNVIVPQIRSVLTMVLVFTIIGGFNVFDIVWVMTQGGPNNASELIATYTYETAFRVREVGYGAALSMVMTVLALLTAWATLKLRNAE
jgi:raffinose/stachyose/melibiose transport system permease protein